MTHRLQKEIYPHSIENWALFKFKLLNFWYCKVITVVLGRNAIICNGDRYVEMFAFAHVTNPTLIFRICIMLALDDLNPVMNISATPFKSCIKKSKRFGGHCYHATMYNICTYGQNHICMYPLQAEQDVLTYF